MSVETGPPAAASPCRSAGGVFTTHLADVVPKRPEILVVEGHQLHLPGAAKLISSLQPSPGFRQPAKLAFVACEVVAHGGAVRKPLHYREQVVAGLFGAVVNDNYSSPGEF